MREFRELEVRGRKARKGQQMRAGGGGEEKGRVEGGTREVDLLKAAYTC